MPLAVRLNEWLGLPMTAWLLQHKRWLLNSEARCEHNPAESERVRGKGWCAGRQGTDGPSRAWGTDSCPAAVLENPKNTTAETGHENPSRKSKRKKKTERSIFPAGA